MSQYVITHNALLKYATACLVCHINLKSEYMSGLNSQLVSNASKWTEIAGLRWYPKPFVKPQLDIFLKYVYFLSF